MTLSNVRLSNLCYYGIWISKVKLGNARFALGRVYIYIYIYIKNEVVKLDFMVFG